MTNSSKTHPFGDDAEYLDAELQWLRCRVTRLLAQGQLNDAQVREVDGDPAFVQRPGRVNSRELRCQVVELKEAERGLRQDIDQRLQVNRSVEDPPTLGLDEVCLEFDLSAEERLMLLVALPFGIAQTMAEDVLQDLARHWGSISVSDAISVLDPQSVGDWLRYRAIFRPGAPLRGLIEFEGGTGTVGPDSLPSADFRLFLEAFARITGNPEAVTEGD